MANIKSAKKRILTNEKARNRNRVFRTLLRNSVKNLEIAIASGDKAAATTQLSATVKRIDSSVTKGIIHKNKAARSKSRLTKKVNAM